MSIKRLFYYFSANFCAKYSLFMLCISIENLEKWMLGNIEWSVTEVKVVSGEILIKGFEDSGRNRNDFL